MVPINNVGSANSKNLSRVVTNPTLLIGNIEMDSCDEILRLMWRYFEYITDFKIELGVRKSRKSVRTLY